MAARRSKRIKTFPASFAPVPLFWKKPFHLFRSTDKVIVPLCYNNSEISPSLTDVAFPINLLSCFQSFTWRCTRQDMTRRNQTNISRARVQPTSPPNPRTRLACSIFCRLSGYPKPLLQPVKTRSVPENNRRKRTCSNTLMSDSAREGIRNIVKSLTGWERFGVFHVIDGR